MQNHLYKFKKYIINMRSDRSYQSVRLSKKQYLFQAVNYVVLSAALSAMPFLAFVKFNGYLNLRPEIIIPLFALLALGALWGSIFFVLPKHLRNIFFAGLVAIFIDFQFDTSIWGPLTAFILALIFFSVAKKNAILVTNTVILTTILSTILLPGELHNASVNAKPIIRANQNLPPILHIILDEHIGIAGMPEFTAPQRETKKRVLDFYLSNGFQIYARAYSRYHHTDDSISNMLNYTVLDVEKAYFENLNEPRVLTENLYFDKLKARGYKINVYQTDWLNLCEGNNSTVDFCHTTFYKSFSPLKRAELGDLEKAWVVSTLYLQLSGLYRKVRALYRISQRSLKFLSFLPIWDWDRERIGPLATPVTVDQIALELSANPRGATYFVHFLLPHSPFVLKKDCSLKPVSDWKSGGYNDQVYCSLILLERLFNALRAANFFNDSIIIVHGDHGSRATSVDLKGSNADRLSARDFVNGFSTIWAIKTANNRAKIDYRIRSVQKLLPLFESCNFEMCDENPADEDIIVHFSDTRLGIKMIARSPDLFTSKQ